MKILTSSLFLLFTTFSLADVAIYNGAQVSKTTSMSGSGTVVEKFIEVVDLTNAKIVVVTLGVASGQKTFSVAAPADVVITEVKDSRSKRISTVLAQSSTSTDVMTGVTTLTSFVQMGGNLQVSIRNDATVGLPRNLQGSATVVATAGVDLTGPIASEYLDIKATLVLQEIMSRVSNDAGDSLAAAVDRIKAGLIAKDYVSA